MALSLLLQFVLGLGLVLQVLPQRADLTLLGPEGLRMADQIQKTVGLVPQRDSALSMVVQKEQVYFEPGQMVMALARAGQTLLDPEVLQMADQIPMELPVVAVAGLLVQKVS